MSMMPLGGGRRIDRKRIHPTSGKMNSKKFRDRTKGRSSSSLLLPFILPLLEWLLGSDFAGVLAGYPSSCPPSGPSGTE
jgi:hypothetical protein